MNRLVVILTCLLAMANDVWSQELKLTKTTVTDFSSTALVVPFDDQPSLSRAQDRISSGSKLSTGKVQIALAPDEKVLSYHGDVVYKYARTPTGQRLTKLVAGAQMAVMNYDDQSVVNIMGTDGTAIFCDLLDGNATKFTFLSASLEQVSEYKPYSEFNYILVSSTERFVAIYSQSGSYADLFKISILSHSGQLLAEREYSKGSYVSSDLKSDDNGIILLMSSSIDGSSKIFRFDNSLNIVWQKQIRESVVTGKLVTSTVNRSIIIPTRDDLVNFSYDTGKEIWRKSFNELVPGVAMKVVDVDFVFDDAYLALSIGDYLKSSRIIGNNLLFVLRRDNGVSVFVDKIGNTSKPPLLINGSESFALLKDKEMIVYKIK